MPATLADLVATSQALRTTRARKQKVAHLTALLRGQAPSDLRLAALYLAGEVPQSRLQLGWSTLSTALGALPPGPPAASGLTLVELDAGFARIAGISGPGAVERRQTELGALLSDAPPEARDFVVRLVTGELRQGALRRIVLEALAAVAGAPVAELEHAVAVAGSFAAALTIWAERGLPALLAQRLQPLVPIEPMLAQPAADLAGALAAGTPVALEHKLDGVRVQVHRAGAQVRIWSRQLRDVTGLAPAIVQLAQGLAETTFVLDGEAIAFDARGRPLAFQDFISLFARAAKPAAGGPDPLPAMEVRFFDLLALGQDTLLDRPYADRRACLERLVPARCLVPQLVTSDHATAERFLAEALAAGLEGIVVKQLGAPYRPGRREAAWLKVKPAVTLDLVILAAEWGHGRRQGWLSNLHLGARLTDQPGRFAMLGKTFKGLTDAMLTQLTAALQERVTARDGHVVHVRPELVVEIAFDSVQRSPRHDSGLALRFARVKRLRLDKDARMASTLDEVRRAAARA